MVHYAISRSESVNSRISSSLKTIADTSGERMADSSKLQIFSNFGHNTGSCLITNSNLFFSSTLLILIVPSRNFFRYRSGTALVTWMKPLTEVGLLTFLITFCMGQEFSQHPGRLMPNFAPFLPKMAIFLSKIAPFLALG